MAMAGYHHRQDTKEHASQTHNASITLQPVIRSRLLVCGHVVDPCEGLLHKLTHNRDVTHTLDFDFPHSAEFGEVVQVLGGHELGPIVGALWHDACDVFCAHNGQEVALGRPVEGRHDQHTTVALDASRAAVEEALNVVNVLDDLTRHNHIKRGNRIADLFAFFDFLLVVLDAVGDVADLTVAEGQPRCESLRPERLPSLFGDFDALLTHVDARHLPAHSGHRLRQNAAPTPDIQYPEPLEWFHFVGFFALECMLLDEGQTGRVVVVQTCERAVRVPPFLRHFIELFDLIRRGRLGRCAR
mmetsp:Transcript_45893/g.114117  ORF Transcript_45893/g.114117 Transcript_45893/m.114117 type:complete len:300 (+) Transcript_45893:331-1230(+)